MNRELKFRAWNIPNKTMYMDIQNGVLCQNEKGQLVLGTSFGTICKDAGSKVMQFTGKKDCTGKEIYEGDIIEFDRIEWRGNDNIHVVSWNNEDACWSWGGGSTSDMEWRTVIGNIYENPELLSE
jgi:uncharacterized phage protein (TIGR01671 family)